MISREIGVDGGLGRAGQPVLSQSAQQSGYGPRPPRWPSGLRRARTPATSAPSTSTSNTRPARQATGRRPGTRTAKTARTSSWSASAAAPASSAWPAPTAPLTATRRQLTLRPRRLHEALRPRRTTDRRLKQTYRARAGIEGTIHQRGRPPGRSSIRRVQELLGQRRCCFFLCLEGAGRGRVRARLSTAGSVQSSGAVMTRIRPTSRLHTRAMIA